MSAAKHTPGPWLVYMDGPSDRQWVDYIGPAGIRCHDAIVQTDSGIYGPSLEDARLIAAAPRLLAALQALLHECTQDGVSERIDRAISEEAYAACEQAEGAGS